MRRVQDGVFVCNILNQYNKVNDFANSQCAKLMNQIHELKERDTAKKPVQTEDGMVCPICGSKAVPWSRFCDECGQRWWEKED